MPADDLLRADLADFTVRLSERLEAIETAIEQARRIALDALDLAGAASARTESLDRDVDDLWASRATRR